MRLIKGSAGRIEQPIPTEYEEQCAVIRWARMMASKEPRLNLLHGDSSGVRVPIGCAVKMKKAGAIKGWPDLFLAVYKQWWNVSSENYQFYHGLFIELKRRKGSIISYEQSEIHALLRKQGYCVIVCRGSDDAIKVIKHYLVMEDLKWLNTL